MSERSEEKAVCYDEMDLIEIWAKSTGFVLKHKYVLLLFPLFFAFLGLGLSRLPAPEWEAVAVIQVGSFSPSELIESTDSLIFRLQSPEFQNVVLSRCGIPPDSKTASLYRGGLAVKPLKPSGMIEVRVRGFSKESALALSSATFSEVGGSQSAIIAQRIAVPKRRLAALDKLMHDMGCGGNNAGQSVSGNKNLEKAVYVISATWPLMDQVEFPVLHPTGLISQSAGNSPVSPRKYNWIVYSAVFGLLLGIVFGLVQDRSGSRRD